MKRKNKSHIFKKILIFVIIVLVCIIAVTVKNGYDMYKAAVDKIPIEDKIDSIKELGYYTTYDEIPKDYINAVLAIEDHRFYSHGAIDIISIGRAVLTDIKNMSLVEGGSTITQQLAKNMYFTQEKKFTRKVAEVFVAYDLEKMYSKNQIVELYINYSYYGDGYTGIGQASRGYFSKVPLELTLDQQTLLAGLPNAPSVYALSTNPDLAIKRQEAVIDAMGKYNFLTEEQIKKIKDKNN